MNVTQPFSRGMQGQMNMVDNMNTAYNVRDQLGDALRNNMAVTQVRQSNPDVTTPDAVVRSKDTPSKVSPTQSSSKPSPKTPTQSFGKPTPLGVSSSPQQNKMSVPISKVEPSGDALSYFRKNKQSGGWNALGTGVSLVQQSMKPEKGGLKSRTEYDRLLRGSDNFKKLDGNEQQRVRQAFAQWMNEQTIFKGKA
jgi:cytoskeletal protein RodZ